MQKSENKQPSFSQTKDSTTQKKKVLIPAHLPDLAERMHAYLSKKKRWVTRKDLVKVAQAVGYTDKKILHALYQLKSYGKDEGYKYIDVAHDWKKEKGELFIVYEHTPEYLQAQREAHIWFDSLPEYSSARP